MNKKITFIEALLTAVGMVIGSGIFFRAARILDSTEGNVGLAVLGWAALGTTLVFAGIGFSILASRTTKEGGIIGYMEDFLGEKAAFATGWFTTFIYIPLLTGILAIIAAQFLFQLIGVDNYGVGLHYAVAFVMIIVCYGWNYFSTKFSALFSSAATVIKLLPIIIVGFIGMTKLDIGVVTDGISAFDMTLFAAPLLSMAFAFDGWTSVATLSKDMENPQKDIAKVLALNAVIVTIAYVVYFTGMTMIVPAQEIMSLGNEHVGVAAGIIMGDFGMKFILFCVVMSVLGTLNGNVMAGFRYPHALAQAKDLPNSEFFVEESKYGTTGKAAMITFGAVCAWFVLYTVQANLDAGAAEGATHMLSGIYFDDIPIMMMAALIIILLVGAAKFGMKEGYGVVKSIIAPIIGIIGQAYVIWAFALNNERWWQYILVCIVIIVIGFVVRGSLKKKA